jgi:hypothetical protein
MKIYLIAISLIVAAATSAFAETYRAPNTRDRSKPRERPAPPLARQPVDGVIPRGVRGGNFLQMFNPKAPAKYGTSQDAVCFDPEPMNLSVPQNGRSDAGKWKGIKLFVFNF